MQPDATLHHGASARVRTDALHYRGFVCHRRTNPEAEWHFTRSCSSVQALRGLHLSSLQHVTICMVLNMCTLFFFFKVRCQGCDLMLESSPWMHSTTFAFYTAAGSATVTATPSQHRPYPPFPRSDGGTEIRAEAASVCLCEGTI